MSFTVPPIEVTDDGEFLHAHVEAPHWACPDCAGRGGFVHREDGYDQWRTCECRAFLRRLETFNAAHLGRRFARSTLESYVAHTPRQRAALHLARMWTDGWRKREKGIAFFGPVGTGKTHLAVGIFRELTLRHGASCRFVDFGHLLADLKRSYERSEGEADIMEPLARVEVLLIDELGKGRATEWENTVLDDLVSRRYNANRLTLFTTNFSPLGKGPERAAVHAAWDARERSAAGGGRETGLPTLEERLDARVLSRLFEMVEFVEVDGEDHRRASRGADRR